MTESPQWGPAGGSAAEEFLELCAPSEAALQRVAAQVAAAELRGQPAADPTELAFRLRAEGAPYVWPRAFVLSGRRLAAEHARDRVGQWLGGFALAGQRRCAVARASSEGGTTLAVVDIDVLADLAPLPRRVRTGSWLEVEAHVLVPYRGATVVVLGPRGAPRPVPTSTHDQIVRGRFALDAPGQWVIQVLAEVAGGPRPVLEAWVFADTEPPPFSSPVEAPGEASARAELDPRRALELMLNVARKGEQRALLRRDGQLDILAQKQAEAMCAAGRLAHDLGNGDPATRLASTGLTAVAAGENLAHALDAARAHRALWASASHRSNLLSAYFDSVGIGTASDPDGSLWACQLFARFAE